MFRLQPRRAMVGGATVVLGGACGLLATPAQDRWSPGGIALAVALGIALGSLLVAAVSDLAWPPADPPNTRLTDALVVTTALALGAFMAAVIPDHANGAAAGVLFGAFAGRVVVARIVGGIRGEDPDAGVEEQRAEDLAGYEAIETPIQLAEWNRRFGARLIDSAIVVLAIVVFSRTAGFQSGAEAMGGVLVAWGVVEIPGTAVAGVTPGKLLLRIRVLAVASATVSVGLRIAMSRAGVLLLNLPFFWIASRVSGDLLWCFSPRISAWKPVYGGALVVPRSEVRRLALLANPEQARRDAVSTVTLIRTMPPVLTRRGAIVVLCLLAGIFFALWVGRQL
jgi:hypothetical protein